VAYAKFKPWNKKRLNQLSFFFLAYFITFPFIFLLSINTLQKWSPLIITQIQRVFIY